MSNSEKDPEPFYLFGFDLEFNRFGAIPFILTIVACLGGIVQWSGGMQNTAQLMTSALLAMLVLSLILAVQPMKRIVWCSAISIVIFLGIILFNLLS